MGQRPEDKSDWDIVEEILDNSYPLREEFDSNFKFQVCRLLYSLNLICRNIWE